MEQRLGGPAGDERREAAAAATVGADAAGARQDWLAEDDRQQRDQTKAVERAMVGCEDDTRIRRRDECRPEYRFTCDIGFFGERNQRPVEVARSDRRGGWRRPELDSVVKLGGDTGVYNLRLERGRKSCV